MLIPMIRARAYKPRPGMPIASAIKAPKPRSNRGRREIEADRAAGWWIGEVEQVEHEQHRHQRENDADELVGQVEPRPISA